MPHLSMLSVGSLAAGLALAGTLAASTVAASGEHPPGNGDTTAEHAGFGLCGTSNIHPVAKFDREFTDSIGNHYHGWLPPAGPPFFELCLAWPGAHGPVVP